MKTQKNTFASLLLSLGEWYDLRMLFKDFLTFTVCALSRDPATGIPTDTELFEQVLAKYQEVIPALDFKNIFSTLLQEVADRSDNVSGNDVLGEFYERYVSNTGGFPVFYPWEFCRCLTAVTPVGKFCPSSDLPQRILDPSCGSGRMLIALAQKYPESDGFYGLTVKSLYVKMAAINLFLNAVPNAEVACIELAQSPNFRMSYRVSSLGIFRVDEADDSELWGMLKPHTLIADVMQIGL